MGAHPLTGRTPRYPGPKIPGLEEVRKAWPAFFGGRPSPPPGDADALDAEAKAFADHFRSTRVIPKFGKTTLALTEGSFSPQVRDATLARLDEADALRADGRLVDAMALASAAADEDPFCLFAWDVLALTYEEAGHHTLARAALFAWQAVDPAEAILGERFSAIAFKEGEYEEGMGWIEWALALDPTSGNALMARARVRKALGVKGWRGDIEAAHRVAPQDTENLLESWFHDAPPMPRGSAVRPTRLHWASRLAMEGDFERAARLVALGKRGTTDKKERRAIAKLEVAVEAGLRIQALERAEEE